MTVTSTTSRVEYIGDGTTVTFSVPFYFIENGDLNVYVGGTLQIITTNYTVAGAGVLAGGSITFVSPPANLSEVIIFRNPALTQGLDYIDNDDFPAESHELGLDRLTMITQRNRDLLNRSLRLPDSTVGFNTELPQPVASRLLGLNAAGTGLQYYELNNIPGLASGIIYNLGVVGAVNRTVQSRLQEKISVRDFGATGDGTNQTIQILAAIAASAGKTLVFPPGVYEVDNNALEPLSGSNWVLQRGAIIKNVTTSDVYNIIILDNLSEFGLLGTGKIIGHTVNSSVANAISLNISQSDNIYVGPIKFDGSNGECIFVGSGGGATSKAENVILDKVDCRNARRNAIAIGDVNDVWVLNPYIDGVANPDHTEICSGIDIEPIAGQSANNVHIIDPTIKNTEGSAITAYGNIGGGSEQISGLFISNPYCEANCANTPAGTDVWPRAAIDIVSVDGGFLNNAVAPDIGNQGGVSVDLARGFTVDGVRVKGRLTTGTYPTAASPTQPQFISGFVMSACIDSVAKNINVEDANYHGVYFYQNQNSKLTGVKVKGSVQIGVVSESNDELCEISDIQTLETDAAGVYSLNDNEPQFNDISITDANKDNVTGANIAGSAMVVATSGGNVCNNPRIGNLKVRTPSLATFQPTYALAFSGNIVAPQIGKDCDLQCTVSQSIYFGTPNDTLSETQMDDVLAVRGSVDSNVTGNGTTYQLVCDTELLDRGGAYNNSTGVFTARRSGKYDFRVSITAQGLTVGASVEMYLRTSNNGFWKIDTADATTETFDMVVENLQLDQGDTAVVEFVVSGVGADTVDIYNGFTSGVVFYATSFSAKLSN